MSEKNLPVVRTNKKDIDRIFGMMAGLQELVCASEEMEKRFRVIPYGWRDLKMCIAVMRKLIDNVVLTVPPEKLLSMQRMLPRMKFKLICGVQPSKMGEDECVISMKDADTLCYYAHEQCKFCVEQKCARCPLAKVLDSVMTYDRNGVSWASVDLEAMRDRYDEEENDR